MVKAILKNYRQSPSKVRLVASEVKGKDVNSALTQLSLIPKRTAPTIKKLIESAVANAKNNHDLDADRLFIKSIVVDEGFTLKRWRPRARGSAFPINKRTSRIVVELSEKGGKKGSTSAGSTENKTGIQETAKKESETESKKHTKTTSKTSAEKSKK